MNLPDFLFADSLNSGWNAKN